MNKRRGEETIDVQSMYHVLCMIAYIQKSIPEIQQAFHTVVHPFHYHITLNVLRQASFEATCPTTFNRTSQYVSDNKRNLTKSGKS